MLIIGAVRVNKEQFSVLIEKLFGVLLKQFDIMCSHSSPTEWQNRYYLGPCDRSGMGGGERKALTKQYIVI